jgi:hypothetical protein
VGGTRKKKKPDGRGEPERACGGWRPPARVWNSYSIPKVENITSIYIYIREQAQDTDLSCGSAHHKGLLTFMLLRLATKAMGSH